MNREAIYVALFGKLQSVNGLVTTSRRWRNVQDVTPQELPAGFQAQGKQKIDYEGSTPSVVTMEAAWVLYNYSDDPNVAPSTGLNVLVDAALAALTPTPQYPMAKNTLGGLVEYAAVVGSIEIYEGVLGNFAVAIIPIKINLAGF